MHQSLVSRELERNLFSNGRLAEPGVLLVYRRPVPRRHGAVRPLREQLPAPGASSPAPINIQWGVDNRPVGIRSPVSTPKARRVENRVIGADANSLRLAATPAAIWASRIASTRPKSKGNAYQGAFELPRSLSEAVSLLRAEHDPGMFLQGVRDVYAEIKDLEHEEFMRVISPWEREHLLLLADREPATRRCPPRACSCRRSHSAPPANGSTRTPRISCTVHGPPGARHQGSPRDHAAAYVWDSDGQRIFDAMSGLWW